MGELRHNAFLRLEDGVLHFGCENPMCCHPHVPNHWKVPLDGDLFKMELLSHGNRKIKIKVTLKIAGTVLPVGETRTLECLDEIEACMEAFNALWPELFPKKGSSV